MSNDIGLLDSKLLTQRFEVGDELVQPERLACTRRFAVSAQIIRDAGKVVLQRLGQCGPTRLSGSDTVNHEERRALSLDRVSTLNRHSHYTHPKSGLFGRSCRRRVGIEIYGKRASDPPILFLNVLNDDLNALRRAAATFDKSIRQRPSEH